MRMGQTGMGMGMGSMKRRTVRRVRTRLLSAEKSGSGLVLAWV